MLCEKCAKKQATVHLTRTQQDKTTEQHLCEDCARSLGAGQQVSNYLDAIGNILGSGVLAGGSLFNTAGGIPNFGPPAAGPALACPVCLLTFDEFRRTGLFGCANCYTAFADRLPAVFRRVQGTTRHDGCRVTATECLQKNRQQRQLVQLREKLKKAVALEEYEKAAQLRDEIKLAQSQFESKIKEGEA